MTPPAPKGATAKQSRLCHCVVLRAGASCGTALPALCGATQPPARHEDKGTALSVISFVVARVCSPTSRFLHGNTQVNRKEQRDVGQLKPERSEDFRSHISFPTTAATKPALRIHLQKQGQGFPSRHDPQALRLQLCGGAAMHFTWTPHLQGTEILGQQGGQQGAANIDTHPSTPLLREGFAALPAVCM